MTNGGVFSGVGRAVGDARSDGLLCGTTGVQRPEGVAGAGGEEAGPGVGLFSVGGDNVSLSATSGRDRTDSMRSGRLIDSGMRPPRELSAIEWNPSPRPCPLGMFDFSTRRTSCLSTLRLATTLASAAESATIECGRCSGDVAVGTASELRISFVVLSRGLRKR